MSFQIERVHWVPNTMNENKPTLKCILLEVQSTRDKKKVLSILPKEQKKSYTKCQELEWFCISPKEHWKPKNEAKPLKFWRRRISSLKTFIHPNYHSSIEVNYLKISIKKNHFHVFLGHLCFLFYQSSVYASVLAHFLTFFFRSS